jgi:nucleotide-binding universal stress UspA family protein
MLSERSERPSYTAHRLVGHGDAVRFVIVTMSDTSGGSGIQGYPSAFAGTEPTRYLVGLRDTSELADLVAYISSVGANGRGIALVVHVVELVGRRDRLALEALPEAARIVDEAVFALRLAGIDTSGTVSHASLPRIGPILIEEASRWRANVIVLHARRRRRWRHLVGHGVREKVLRRSTATTVLVSHQILAEERGQP